MKTNAARQTNRAKPNKPSILFVDDEQRVLNSMRALFRRDYNLYLTTRGDEALKIIEQNAIDVVIADQRMPIMTGVEILSRVKVSSPNTIRILLTGYSNATAIEGAMNSGEVYKFLNKPCPVDELRSTVRKAAEIATVTARKIKENDKQKVAARSFTDSMRDVRVKPSLAERLNRIMEAVNSRTKSRNAKEADTKNNDAAQTGKEESPVETKTQLPRFAESVAEKHGGNDVPTDAALKATEALKAKAAPGNSARPAVSEASSNEEGKGATNKPAHNTAREHERPAESKPSVSATDAGQILNSVGSDASAVLSASRQEPALNAEPVESGKAQSVSDVPALDIPTSNSVDATRRITIDDELVDGENSATKSETIKLEFDLIGKVDEDEAALSEFADKALSPQSADTQGADATADSGKDNEQGGTSRDHNQTTASYAQLKDVVHAIPPGLNDRISAKISRSIAAKPKPVVPINKIPALNPEPFADKNVDENLFSESVTEKRTFPALTVPDDAADKERAKAAANEKFESVEITLGGNTHEIVDLTHSVEIIMSGDNHRIRDRAEEPLLASTDKTLPGGMGGFGHQPDEVVEPQEAAELGDEIIEPLARHSHADENRRLRVVGTGKYRISIVVFSADKAFAKSVGRSLHGFFYTFHATTIEQLTNAIEGIDPAVLITDVSTEPEVVQELIARLKLHVPELVTMVASQHRDADLMVKLINYGQVFRMVDKPMSPTACKMYVREALKRHLQLRKNPELMRQHIDRKIEGESKLPSNISRLISGLKLDRVRRLFG